MHSFNVQCSLALLFLYSDFPYSTTNCHFPPSHQIDEPCVALDSAKQMEWIILVVVTFIYLVFQQLPGGKGLASSEDALSGYRASDETTRSKETIVQNWVTHAKFWKIKPTRNSV